MEMTPPINSDIAPSSPPTDSNGDTLRFTPHDFHQPITIQFPPQRLPVCENCKRNCKSRDICRVKCGHTDVPWTTAYICITLDESCFGEDGKCIGQPLTAKTMHTQPFPYCIKTEFADPKTPCCASCKYANRTRGFCREVHKHRYLPWDTVYVVLSATEKLVKEIKVQQITGDNKGKGADKGGINKITPFRTYLSTVSTKQNSIQSLNVGAIVAPKKNGSFSPCAATGINQRSTAVWQANYNQTCTNHLTMMQNQKSAETGKKGKRSKKKAQKNGEGNIPQIQRKKISEEAMAAIANANIQAHSEYNAQLMRQQFVNSQMCMQQMMQMQQQQARQIQQQQQGKVDYQSQPPKKRGRKKSDLEEEDAKTSSNTDVSIADDEAKEAEFFPEEDGEILDWFDASFGVK